MKFFLLLSIIISSSFITCSAYINDDRIKNLQTQINDVKIKVDNLLKICKNGTTNSTLNEQQPKGVVTTFLYSNETLFSQQNETSSNSTSSNFFSKLKEKIQKFFHIKKDSKNKEAVKIKRCLSATVGRNGERINIKVSDDSNEQLKHLLMKFFKCLSIHGGNWDASSTEPSDTTEPNYSITTSSPGNKNDEANDTKTDAFLRYLASSKHSVEEVGKPKYNKPDLRKTQEIIDNAKSSMWMNFDVEEITTVSSTTTEDYENVPELPILKREASAKKDKRNGLFRGIINSVNDLHYEIPNLPLNSETSPQHDDPIQEVNKLVQKLDSKQQEDLFKFLDQLNEKPKEFKFNVDKYYMLAFENITKSAKEHVEGNENDLNVGARKYFEFDSGRKRKRHSKDKRIEQLKERFVNQFKDHRHEKYVNLNRVVERINNNHADNSFLDKSYRLNDGSIKTSELIKPLHLVNHVKSPKEVKMDIELGEKFKEIEEWRDAENENKNANGDSDAPFYKTEGQFEADGRDLYP